MVDLSFALKSVAFEMPKKKNSSFFFFIPILGKNQPLNTQGAHDAGSQYVALDVGQIQIERASSCFGRRDSRQVRQCRRVWSISLKWHV
jgi:hypothetical protein